MDATENADDRPWANLARELRLGGAVRDVLGRSSEGAALLRSLEADARTASTSALFDLWGQCLTFDEVCLAPIVDQPLLASLHAIVGLEHRRSPWHAGVTHTYGYLFSLLVTPYGFKRQRWVRPDLAKAFDLTDGLLGPLPHQGTLLVNATWLLGRIAFANEAEAAAVETLGRAVAPELMQLALPFDRRVRIIETMKQAGRSYACRTDLFDLRQTTPSGHSHLLVYSVKVNDEPARLVSGFPVTREVAAGLLDAVPPDHAIDLRPRFNAYVDGLSRLGTWRRA